MKRVFFGLALIALSLAVIDHASPTVTVSAKTEKLRRSERPIPNRYIVVLADEDGRHGPESVARTAEAHRQRHQLRVDRVFGSAIKGYSAEMSAEQAERLSQDPGVAFVEQDSIVEAQAVQANAGWGLGRIDQRNTSYPLDSNYEFMSTGQGVNVYVLDSGILTTHPDFGGRAVDAYDYFNDPTPISQCNGHGTHVAGTIGSATYGVAKAAVLYSVRVLPCSGFGTLSSVVGGIDWVDRHAARPAVANMSLASLRSDALEQAVQSSINRGIVYTVSAGNYGADACSYSPAHLPDAITVGSIDNRDYRDPSTNYGACVDLFAPGVGIVSTWNSGGTFNMGGTSTAAPHAAGAAALFLELNPSATPAQVAEALTNASTRDVLGDIGSRSPNRLLYTLFAPASNTCEGTGYSGQLYGVGDQQFHSGEDGFSISSGKIRGKLRVSADVSFRLSLEKKQGRRWSEISGSNSVNGAADMVVSGKSGMYRWRISSFVGSGTYELCSELP